MRKYTVEEKTLKMKMSQKEHDRRTDYLQPRSFRPPGLKSIAAWH